MPHFSSIFTPAKPEFDETKSLYDNFNVMCKLSSFRIGSDHQKTTDLKETLKKCELAQENNLMDYQARNDLHMSNLAKLETVKIALKIWHEERDKFSSRVPAINNFEEEIAKYQERIIKKDNRDFYNQRTITSWSNPLQDKEYDWTQHLAKPLQNLFYVLRNALTTLRSPINKIQPNT